MKLRDKGGLTLIIIIAGLFWYPYLGGGGEGGGPNLIPNPGFRKERGERDLPAGWHQESLKVPGVEPSRVFISQISGHPENFLTLVGGQGRGGRVWCEVSGIRLHTNYLLEFAAYRPRFINDVYLEVEIFGQRHLINQHFSYGGVQPIFLRINSGNTRGKTRLIIENPHKEELAFASPSLKVIGALEKEGWEAESARLPGFFPVGIFNAKVEDLPDIRAAGFNALQSYDDRPDSIKQMASTSARLGLKFLPNFRRYRADISQQLGGRPELLGFYIEDEPEGRSVPVKSMQALKEALKRDNPGVLTTVAMLRPQMVGAYREAADVFMLDPYPVPNMPMTWMSDTLEEAARHVPRERLWAVVQAFGGSKWAKHGWPRLPTYMEMRCLTYLAVVHGAHGLFYWNYPEVKADRTSWEALKKIAAELRQLRTWLVVPDAPQSLRLEMTSPFKVDANGRPAVHFSQKKQGAENLLILVNVIDRPVSFYLYGFSPQAPWLNEMFQQHKSVVHDGNIREELGPYEVRVYRYRREA